MKAQRATNTHAGTHTHKGREARMTPAEKKTSQQRYGNHTHTTQRRPYTCTHIHDSASFFFWVYFKSLCKEEKREREGREPNHGEKTREKLRG